MAREIDPRSSMAALFGARVRKLRTAAGPTRAEPGRRAYVVDSRITRIERACGARPTPELARAPDEILNADSPLTDRWPYVHRETFPDRSRAFMEQEYSARAVRIHEYAAHVVPGLLQTPDYAGAVLSLDPLLRDERQLEERVTARPGRQRRLEASDRPEVWFVLDEAVPRRPVASPSAMRRQWAHMPEMANTSRVTIQVLPFACGRHEVMGGSLTVLTMADRTGVAYTEGADHGRLTEETEEVDRYSLLHDRLRAVALPRAWHPT